MMEQAYSQLTSGLLIRKRSWSFYRIGASLINFWKIAEGTLHLPEVDTQLWTRFGEPDPAAICKHGL